MIQKACRQDSFLRNRTNVLATIRAVEIAGKIIVKTNKATGDAGGIRVSEMLNRCLSSGVLATRDNIKKDRAGVQTPDTLYLFLVQYFYHFNGYSTTTEPIRQI